ncbi:MAG: PEP-CTERM sorting domain-containing protein, partial [Halieaceae bacterium]|nr:PEP-CTERM sorting domain-containing protein [Halieaceae bacterium]
WTEGRGFGSFAIVRGGEFAYGDSGLAATYRRIRSLTRESGDIGFRIASSELAAGGGGGGAVPEPSALLLLLLGLGLLPRRLRRRRR